jgi:hypothetical protein
MLKLLFLFSLAITIILTIVQISGFAVIDLIIIMIVIDFLSLGAYLEMENKKTSKESKGLITSKLEGIENICKDIFTHITSPNPGFEAKLEKQKDDMNYILDKISHKSLELEEKLNTFGKVLIKTIDEKKSEEKIMVEEQEEPKEEKPQEETSETFNVGEIVYVDDEEE